jgi:oxygen-dependent protoporphyrinogen oxidase
MTTPTADHTRHADSSTITGSPPALRVAVVGGGITGLACAWYLEQMAAERDIDLAYTLLEACDRWGGKLLSERVKGPDGAEFVVEAGPDSFLTGQKPWGLQLARELGLEDRILDTNDSLRKVFVLKKGRLVPLPDGVMMVIPTRIMPFALSPLISIPGKLRMGMDLFIPARRDGQDETIAGFIGRRLGAEAVDRLADPLMSGIYNAESDRQSVLATFPRFRTIEEQHGSLIRGMIAARRAGKQAPAPPAGEKRHGMFVSLRDGTQELSDALAAQLSGDLRLGAAVLSLDRLDGGGYRLTLENEETLEVDQVILTTPAFVAADLLCEMAPEAGQRLSAIRYLSTGTVSLAYRADQIGHPLDGFGLVIPRSERRSTGERRSINAVTWTSTKFDHRAPGDYALLRVFFGGSRSPQMMEHDDRELLRLVRGELRDIMGIGAEPVMVHINRWWEANPQYDTGHLDHVAAIEAALPDGVYVTGSAYRGIGIPDCVRQAKETAQAVIEGVAAGE